MVFLMSDQELTRLDTIKRLNEQALIRAQAADLLGLSVRQIQRLVNQYRQDGVAGMVSKKRGLPSNRRYPGSFKEYALYLVKTHYRDFGPTFACEKLNEFHQLNVSVAKLHNWMLEAGIWVSRKESNKRIYQPRYRRDCLGELIQIDGSDHYWFEDPGPRRTLLVFTADATSQLMALRFVPSETTFDYFQVTKHYLETYGKPIAFYSDKHSVF